MGRGYGQGHFSPLVVTTSTKDIGPVLLTGLHHQFHWYIETAWICATGLGIILFLVEIGENWTYRCAFNLNISQLTIESVNGPHLR